MTIRPLTSAQLRSALRLVWQVYCETEGVKTPEAGRAAFWDAIHEESYLSSLRALGAYDQDQLIGILAVREEGAHIALFFVERSYQQQGVGRTLLSELLKGSTAPVITVHSSFYAVKAYKRLGFRKVGEARTEGGISYLPMELRRSL